MPADAAGTPATFWRFVLSVFGHCWSHAQPGLHVALQLIPHLKWDTHRGYANVRYSGFLGAQNVTALPLDPALRNASADTLFKEGYSDKFKSPWDMTLQVWLIGEVYAYLRLQQSMLFWAQQRLDLASRLHSALWGPLFEEIAGPLPAALANPCCSTFLVKRDAIRLRPRAFYQNLLKCATMFASQAVLCWGCS